ncbi:MAG: efflux RND transporter periplasmic adaptor subunit [Burkholderiaceae bacterium]|nr:efflux RND transporter periplasmic adaptor subunit [Burkholderiaceae bacterium]
MPLQVRFRKIITILVLLIAAGLIAWHFLKPSSDHNGIAYGNGRLEATEVDVATKVPGRVAEMLVREGDNLTTGQIAARLDAEDLAAQLRAGEAAASQARDGVASAVSQQKLAKVTLARTRELIKKGFISADRLDRDISSLQTADAALAAARNRVSEADARVDALRVNVHDTSLKAPVAGRVLYRLTEPGEFLAAGGKAFTLLDLADVYMSIYLPAEEAGKIALGSEGRILLDALPDMPIPAKVVFVAPRSQFTPKEVETRNEREKLMFRIKIKVDPEWLRQNAEMAKPGMPGLAYVRTEPGAPWPAKQGQ